MYLMRFAILLVITISANAQDSYLLKENIPYYEESVRKSDDYLAERCKLDIYYPENVKEFATVVWFHGGGLMGGEKYIPEILKEKGLAVVAVNYRLSPKALAPAYLEDAAAAVAWTMKHISEYGGNADKIFVSGHSAGGYLTMMVGLDKKWLAAHKLNSDDIAGYLPLSGQTFTHSTIRQERGISNIQTIVDEYGPLYHVRAKLPPLVLITGDRRFEISGRYEENAALKSMMEAAGHKKTILYELQGYTHMVEDGALPLVLGQISRILNEMESN